MSVIKISKSRVDLGTNRLDNAILKDCGEIKTAPTISTGTLTLDLSTGNVFEVSLNANVTTLSITNVIATGTAQSFTLVFTADGTPRTVAWGTSIAWPSGTAPTLTSTSGKKDFFTFYTSTAGTTWYGLTVGQNLAPIASPVNTVAPVVSGTAQSGQTLSCTTGTWTGTATITYTYQWQHGTTDIGGATSNTYLLDNTYIGETIRCVVTATNGIAPDGIANSNSTSAVAAAPPFITATGGDTIATDGNYKVHTFTGTGTFTITALGSDPTYGNKVDKLVIAGGGGGGNQGGTWNGGGGAGGFLYSTSQTVTATAYSITVGGGGPAATKGSNSQFGSDTAAEGGGKGGENGGSAGNGGSGGGGGQSGTGGIGSQGNNGGSDTSGNAGAGGGGKGSVGANGTSNQGGNGGSGEANSITGTSVMRAVGGGGSQGTGGTGSADGGGHGDDSGGTAATAGTANTGNGGGGGKVANGKAGGSGVVIVRYKFQ